MPNKSGPPKGAGAPPAPHLHEALTAREQIIADRETWVRVRERAASEHEHQLDQREDELQPRAEADNARVAREHLLVQLREANEELVVATLRADELAAAEAEGRRRAETLAAQLRADEHEFRTLANTAPILAWFADPEGKVAWYNERWYEYTGTSPGQQSGWSTVLDPADLARVEARWEAALVTGEPWEDVFRLRRHDGALRWFLSRAHPLRDASGNIVRWFGTNVDIDDRKRAEDEVQAGSRVKDEFLAMLGHELRNPLAPILTALDLISMSGQDAHEREHTIIQRQVKHLARLVDDLLDVSRITSGKLELQRAPIELAGVVARAVEMVSPLLEANQHALTVDVPETGLLVDADATRLAQAIGNVLSNSAKYTPARGSIAVTGERRDGRLTLRIRDTGIGISKEMLSRVFDLFAQERQSIDRSRGGLGLGLAIVRTLVRMHGGTVTADSPGLGRGSEFVIELPATSQPARLEARTSRERKPPAARSKVLVVDDNRDVAEMTAAALEELGHEVRVAFDGPMALTIGASFVPDVVLLDIGLPVMDGYEVAIKLRELLMPREVHFVAITGYGQAGDYRRSEAAGFDRHLVKPVTLATLQDSIAAAKHHG